MSAAPPMTKPLMVALAEYHESQARYMRNRVANARCESCTQWSARRCEKYQVVPPADIQRVGCDDYEFDDIPF